MINNIELATQQNNNTKYLFHSIVFLQIAIAINVLSNLFSNCIRHLMLYFPQSNIGPKVIYILSPLHQVILLASSCLILIGLWRIIYLLKSKIHRFYSMSAIVVFFFYFLLKVVGLWKTLTIYTGGGFTQNNWPVIGLLILPPLGIVSCYVIGNRLILHYSAFMNQRKIIQWLTISFAIIWFLRIAFSFILWIQNSQTIEFSLRWLVMYNHRWQLESILFWRTIRYLNVALLLWHVWFFFCLRSVRFKCRRFLIEKSPNDNTL